ncbi:hypothetical protein [Enterococcus malodoratus]|uniref:hypothetical protein n=1 Tax=Enterococcus malodoratus TaxID=71451 RepID=UPI002073AF3A|nr:hypothetical protein [Enterococcus malodoratus]
MDYKRLYAIYCNEEDNSGYISGKYYFSRTKYLHITELYFDQYPDDDVPIQVLQIANIETFSCKSTAQRQIKKYTLCTNIEDIENLVVRELSYREIELIDRCRRFMEGRKKAQLYLKQFENKNFECSACGNKDISEMIVGEMTYQVLDEHETTRVDVQIPKEVSVYCNKCATKIYSENQATPA